MLHCLTSMKTTIFNFIFLSFFTPCILFADAPRDSASIISTIAMIEDVVRSIKPQEVNSLALIGSGVDPHLFKPTRTDMLKLLSSEIVFLNGLHLEGKMIEPINKLSLKGKKIVSVAELLPSDQLIQSKEFDSNFDPHVWMDPVLWSLVVSEIKKTLILKYPESAQEIEKKCTEYLNQIRNLDDYIKKSLNTIPETSRVLITAHDAFAYFGKRYNLEVLGIQGISTESEASVHDIEALVSTIISKKIKAVFLESTISEKNIKALLEGVRAKGQEVKIGGQLYSDAMGKEGTYLGTYVGMIDHNVTTIVNALGGSAPKAGMNNKL